MEADLLGLPGDVRSVFWGCGLSGDHDVVLGSGYAPTEPLCLELCV